MGCTATESIKAQSNRYPTPTPRPSAEAMKKHRQQIANAQHDDFLNLVTNYGYRNKEGQYACVASSDAIQELKWQEEQKLGEQLDKKEKAARLRHEQHEPKPSLAGKALSWLKSFGEKPKAPAIFPPAVLINTKGFIKDRYGLTCPKTEITETRNSFRFPAHCLPSK